MPMHVHEIHAAVVHGPLVLLPTAAAVDLAAAFSGNRGQARVGRTLWWCTVGSGLLAGLAGMAASQETKARDESAHAKMWLHGALNVGFVLGALGIAAWRSAHRPSVGVALAGLAASAGTFYTAYLGGEMVYGHGIGVRAMPAYAPNGVAESPPVLSKRALPTLLRDAAQGFLWLVRRGAGLARGQAPLGRGAFGLEDRNQPQA
jgi:uncharacterized membrane protein